MESGAKGYSTSPLDKNQKLLIDKNPGSRIGVTNGSEIYCNMFKDKGFNGYDELNKALNTFKGYIDLESLKNFDVQGYSESIDSAATKLKVDKKNNLEDLQKAINQKIAKELPQISSTLLKNQEQIDNIVGKFKL